jgi:hypothetical protein
MPSRTALPSATPAAPPSAPPPPWSAGSGAAAPVVGPSVGWATAAEVDDGGSEVLVREPDVELAVALDEPRPADVDPLLAGVLAGAWVFSLVGGALAVAGLWVGFVLVGFGDGLAASCGQMVSARVPGGGVRPPSCQTQPSVEPGFGLCVAGPSVA